MRDTIPDFRRVTGFDDIQQKFLDAANSIIKDHKIVIGERTFDVTSLELYLRFHKLGELWNDPFIDRGSEAEEQFNAATWYIRQKKGAAYWRIDITAGNKAEVIQAGILIRGVNNIDGPARALHSFIKGSFSRRHWSSEELQLIKQIHGKRIDGSDGSPLRLEQRSTPLKVDLAKGKRKNLPKKDTKNSEGISIRDAALRVSIWKRYSADEKIS
jgi:hypothetical protein